MTARVNYVILYGGWYQRTTLHLSEIYGFLRAGYSDLPLSRDKLKMLHDKLDIQSVTREAEHLEYVRAITGRGIEIRYYEDGLYVLQLESNDINGSCKLLESYFNEYFNPAISYIFSLGAPTPKVLANIEISHPSVIGVITDKPQDFKPGEDYGESYSQLSSDGFKVIKTSDFIFVVSGSREKAALINIMEMQIFFREFKDQLERYLQIHRNLWEEITKIRERKYVLGKEVQKMKSDLDGYLKTINLIKSRINQMGIYVHTRSSLSKSLKIRDELKDLFQYKFETLIDTHNYIKEIWVMTADYLTTAIDSIKNVEANQVSVSIRSIEAIASIGVLAGIINYLTKDTLPKITVWGVFYLIVLMACIWPINRVISVINKNRRFYLKFPDHKAV